MEVPLQGLCDVGSDRVGFRASSTSRSQLIQHNLTKSAPSMCDPAWKSDLKSRVKVRRRLTNMALTKSSMPRSDGGVSRKLRAARALLRAVANGCVISGASEA